MTANPNVFIAAGSNVEPERHLALAARELKKAFPAIRFSPWYRNRAAGFTGDDFINFAAGFTTGMAVHEVLSKLRDIEVRCGRSRNEPKTKSPPLDLDLLLYGDLICDESGLTLPRPELLERAYLLGPLADIAPEVMHPIAATTIGELWKQFGRAAHPLIRVAAP